MARIVIAGRSDCARYAKAEAVADMLHRSLPEFKVHKVVLNPDEWDDWLAKTCKKFAWKHARSPLIWRELVDRGGKGMLIGDENHFLEYARAFYNVELDAKTQLLKQVALENVNFKVQNDFEECETRQKYKPYTVVFTNAGNPLTYHLIPFISQGVFGERTQLEYRLLDADVSLETLDGIRMEIQDLAISQIREVNIFNQLDEQAFRNAHLILLLDDVQQQEGESKRLFLQRVAEFYRARAKLIAGACSSVTRVVVAAGCVDTPLNFILNTMRDELRMSSMQLYNLVGVPRLLENQARHLLAEKLGTLPAKVHDVALWGNLGAHCFLDVRFAKVFDFPGAVRGPKWFGRSVPELIWDKRWLNKQVHTLLVKRGGEVHSKFPQRPTVAFANAIASCIRDWLNGMPENVTISNLVVCTEGYYGVPANTFFCFPVRFNPPGYWSVFDDIMVTAELQSKLDAAVQSIKDEYDTAFGPELPPLELGLEAADEQTVAAAAEAEAEAEAETDGQAADSKLSQIAEELESFSRTSTKHNDLLTQDGVERPAEIAEGSEHLEAAEGEPEQQAFEDFNDAEDADDDY